ncbi:MAG: S49 family peptidase [Candidatus Bathyarchaeota archaeon]|nr:S49 family peptidase [Candidatus Bathyarchaeota archaeon]
MEKVKSNKGTVAFALISVIMIVSMASLYFWEPESNIILTTKKGIIGVIEIHGVIEDSEYASILSAAVQEAIDDDDVKAVVLEIDSPGGSAYLIEQVYLDILKLKETKPVVASAHLALSGGYYLAVSADQIFALPAAMVGNVGVIGVGPGFLVPSESTFETGPHKITGFSPALFPFNITSALDSFAGAVVEGRGDRLNIELNDLKRGSIFLGAEAVNHGIVDEIGSRQNALSYAANLTGLESYEVESLVARVADDFVSISEKYPSINELNEANPPPALYFLYMPNVIYMENGEPIPTLYDSEENETDTMERLGQVVVDLSHGNKVSPWILDSITEELSKRNVFVGYGSEWENIEKALDYATCLFIVAPTESYSYEEYQTIKEFVDNGNMLVFLSDASVEFLSTSAMLGPINSLANHWGLHFGKGYLYNVDRYYGFYRNIEIIQFEDSWLTEDLEKLIFFTAGHISITDSDAAYAIWGTQNSVSEKVGLYPTVAMLEKGNTTVVAIADITWLMEPWISVEDNRQLAMNLVEAIAEKSTPEE